MFPQARRNVKDAEGCKPKALALVASLALSAVLMALSLGSVTYWWLGWVTLVPLFLAIRVCRPTIATAAGAFWGFSLYLSSYAFTQNPLPHGWVSALLLTIAPAIYAAVFSAITQRKGFQPLLLGLGWAGLELVLKPLAIHNGLLAGTQGNNVVIHTVGQIGGYVLVAFLVALFNASLISVIAEMRISVSSSRPLVLIPPKKELLLGQEPKISRFFLPPLQPRAPPRWVTN
ncbi:MAG: hypothetical protein AABZ47_15355 [Planctomycetota bacterium]